MVMHGRFLNSILVWTTLSSLDDGASGQLFITDLPDNHNENRAISYAMPVREQHEFASSLTVLPSMTSATCPICYKGNDPLLKLACKHFICTPCGSKATSYGLNTCPQCRAPALLDVDQMMEAFEAHRDGYASWRKGGTRGARGEPADIRLPPQMTCIKGTVHHFSAGIVFVHRKEMKMKSLKCDAEATPLNAKVTSVDASATSLAQISDKHLAIPRLHSALLGPASHELSSAVVFAWWPKSSMWSSYRVEERTQRGLAALRPGIDLLALPDLPDSRDIFEAWCGLYNLKEWQAVFFDPLLPIEPEDLEAHPDPSGSTLSHVLEVLATRYPDAAARSCLHIYHSHLDGKTCAVIEKAGFGCLGDIDEHALIGSLSEAKGWIHADFDSTSQRPSLTRSLATGEINCDSLHTPRGYVCHSATEQRLAFHQLKASNPSTRVVLKPTDGLGCIGLVLDAQEADLAPTDHAVYLRGENYTVEEMVGARGGISPTVYMIGSTPIAVADQLMDGTRNKGNISPSSADAELQRAMTEAGVAIGNHLGLTGQWGLDFVIDESTRAPVVVDLNMGRPNGSLAYYMWGSVQTRPSDRLLDQLHQIAISRSSPADHTAGSLIELLRDSGLLWQTGCAEGVVPVQFISAHASSLLCASWYSRSAALTLVSRLQELDQHATYYFVVD